MVAWKAEFRWFQHLQFFLEEGLDNGTAFGQRFILFVAENQDRAGARGVVCKNRVEVAEEKNGVLDTFKEFPGQ